MIFGYFARLCRILLYFLQVQIISGQLSRSLANSGNRSGKTLDKEFFENSVQWRSRESLQSFFRKTNLTHFFIFMPLLNFRKSKILGTRTCRGFALRKILITYAIFANLHENLQHLLFDFWKIPPPRKELKATFLRGGRQAHARTTCIRTTGTVNVTDAGWTTQQ
jgi:hypothetical protein